MIRLFCSCSIFARAEVIVAGFAPVRLRPGTWMRLPPWLRLSMEWKVPELEACLHWDILGREGANMGKGLLVVLVVIVLVVIGFGQYISVKNTLVAKNEAVKSTWSQVDVVLQLRADLIPN